MTIIESCDLSKHAEVVTKAIKGMKNFQIVASGQLLNKHGMMIYFTHIVELP